MGDGSAPRSSNPPHQPRGIRHREKNGLHKCTGNSSEGHCINSGKDKCASAHIENPGGAIAPSDEQQSTLAKADTIYDVFVVKLVHKVHIERLARELQSVN